MDVFLALALAAVAVAVVTVAVFAVPALRQMRRTAARIEAVTVRVEGQLDPLLADIRQVLAEIRQGVGAAETIAVRLSQLAHLLEQTGRWVAGARAVVDHAVTPPVATLAGIAAGVRDAFRVLLRGRGREDGPTSDQEVSHES